MTLTSLTQNPSLGLILDMDGTLMRGAQPLAGLTELFNFLHRRAIPYIIATNNATRSPEDYQQMLARCSVWIDKGHILTTGMVTASTLLGLFPQGASVYVIGQPALHAVLQKSGFNITADSTEPVAAVVVGGDQNLTYEKLKHATLHLQRGVQFIGTNPDTVYPTEEGLIPECGTTLAALQAATGVAPLIIGKPAPVLFNQAVELLRTPSENTFVVGDRLETDILGGLQAGCRTILVTTGVDRESSAMEKDIHPDFIVHDLFELTTLLVKLIQ